MGPYVMSDRTESTTTITCSKRTRDKLRALKRGDIVTYEELFQAMIQQYNAEQGLDSCSK
jgi:hypothetical protein